MTEYGRFQCTVTNGEVYNGRIFDQLCRMETTEVVDLLNQLSEEYEKLKKEYLKLKHRHSLLHDECLDVECERDSLKKDVEYLEKENEQLYELIDFVNTLIVFKSSESCQMEWEKRLKELKSE